MSNDKMNKVEDKEDEVVLEVEVIEKPETEKVIENDITDYLEQYYSNYDEEGRLLSKHGKVEYITTMTYLH